MVQSTRSPSADGGSTVNQKDHTAFWVSSRPGSWGKGEVVRSSEGVAMQKFQQGGPSLSQSGAESLEAALISLSVAV